VPSLGGASLPRFNIGFRFSHFHTTVQWFCLISRPRFQTAAGTEDSRQ
jgi:hypothetical protein